MQKRINRVKRFIRIIEVSYLHGSAFSALIISFLVTIVPTARAHNTGYVDPNLYIGYATNLKWLVESGGYEYHATRLPFIGFINLLLNTSIENFGILYKFFTLFWLVLIVLKTCKQIEIPKTLSIGLAFLISFSPLVVSALSWTMPNAFAAVFSCALLVYVFKEKIRKFDIVSIGFLITTSFLLNAFGSSLIIILILATRFLYRNNVFSYVKETSIIVISAVLTAISYQGVWNYALNIPGSLWKPHFDVIFNRALVTSNWVPFSNPISQGVTSYLILGSVLLLLAFACKLQRIPNLNTPIFALLLTYTYTWITYFMQLNFSFNAFWYYYIYIPLFVLVGIIALKLFLTIYHPKVWSLQSITKPKYVIMILLPTLVFMMFFTQFKNPSLMTGYNSNSNKVSSLLLKDEIALNKALTYLPSQSKQTATWYEPDPEGYRGALISSTSFHLIRFEGVGENQTTLDLEDYLKRNGVAPSCLAMITSVRWEPNLELKNMKELEKVSQITLPSEKASLSIYCKKEL
jgi:hypothetical protein